MAPADRSAETLAGRPGSKWAANGVEKPANKVPRATSGMTHQIEVLLDDACDGLYEAVVECTEEAIVNALCMATDMRGQSDHLAPALPLDDLTKILSRHHAARERV